MDGGGNAGLRPQNMYLVNKVLLYTYVDGDQCDAGPFYFTQTFQKRMSRRPRITVLEERRKTSGLQMNEAWLGRGRQEDKEGNIPNNESTIKIVYPVLRRSKEACLVVGIHSFNKHSFQVHMNQKPVRFYRPSSWVLLGLRLRTGKIRYWSVTTIRVSATLPSHRLTGNTGYWADNTILR